MASILNTLRAWRCDRMQTHLVDLAAGTLDAGKRQSVDVHLRGCAHCREAVNALRMVPQTFSSAETDDPGPQYWLQQRHAIMRTIREIEPAPEHETEVVRGVWDWRIAIVPVTAVLVAGLGWIALQRQLSTIADRARVPIPTVQVEDALLEVAPMFGVDLVDLASLDVMVEASVEDAVVPLDSASSTIGSDLTFEDLNESDQNLALEWIGDVG